MVFKSKSSPPHRVKSPHPADHKALSCGGSQGYLLLSLERVVVLQICRDAGRAEGVIADAGLDAGVGRAALNHAIGRPAATSHSR